MSASPADEAPVRALVLAGGGLKVAFQAGVLQVLLDEARTPAGDPLHFAVADGASGGAFNLAMLCQGLTGRQIADNWRRTRPLEGVSLNWRQWVPVPLSIFTYDAFRRQVLRRTWRLDWNSIRDTGLKASFNMFDFDEQRHHTWPAAQMHESALIGAVTLPMWFPPVRLTREGQTHSYIDAVFATNANLEAVIKAGATELWVIWTENQRGLYRRGFVHEYFQMIEAVSNSRVRAVIERIRRSNDAGVCGEFGRHIEVRWLSAEIPPHYLFSLSRASMAEAVERGVAEGRTWCRVNGLRVDATEPAETGGQVRFRERMAGAFDYGPGDPADGAAAGAGTDTAMSARLQVTIADVDHFIADHGHRGTLAGSIRCEVFGGERTLTGGTVGLLWDAGDATHKRLSYRFTFQDREQQDVTLFGLKYVVNDAGRADLWSDTTTLYVHLFRGRFSDRDAPTQRDLIGCGMLTISVGSFLYQLTTFRGTAGPSGGALRSVGRFGRFFLRQLRHVYGQPAGPEVLPRHDPPVPAVPAVPAVPDVASAG